MMKGALQTGEIPGLTTGERAGETAASRKNVAQYRPSRRHYSPLPLYA
jgi:hypothetical protein